MYMPAQIQLKMVQMVEIEPESDVRWPLFCRPTCPPPTSPPTTWIPLSDVTPSSPGIAIGALPGFLQ